MRGNSRVRFLGGWGRATGPGYPRVGKAGHRAKGDRWSDHPDVKVREMRNAETVLGVIRERKFQAETTGELLEIERLTSSLQGGGGNRTQPVSRKGLRTPAQADTSPAA